MQRARDAAVAAHVENRSALRDQVGLERLGQECRRGEVDGDRSLPPLTRQLFESELLADARVVDEQAHRALLLRDIRHRLHILESLEVGAHADRLTSERGGQPHRLGSVSLPAAVAENHAIATLGRFKHESAANPARPAGHDRERRCQSFTNSWRGKSANTPCPVSVTRKQSLSPKPQPSIHIDRKSTRLNSSHSQISYAVFCL